MDNSSRYLAQKIALRRDVLRLIQPAHALDLFAGRGEMWRHVWRYADGYLGIDKRVWRSDEPHHRIIADNKRAVRSLNLRRYNVFDVDAYGEPWTMVLAIAEHRQWDAGEIGALVLTDGSSMKLRFGSRIKALETLIPRHPDFGLRDITTDVHRQALGAWCKLCNVEPIWWRSSGGATGNKGNKMLYSATVFRGRKT